MKKDNFIYPAIFTYDDDGITTLFPDLPGCLSCADTDEKALYMAKDALRGYLLTCEDMGAEINDPTPLKDIFTEANQRAVLINVCLAFYRKANNNRAVKKTLTIPAWLNEAAERENINFSFVLQNALREELNIQEG